MKNVLIVMGFMSFLGVSGVLVALSRSPQRTGGWVEKNGSTGWVEKSGPIDTINRIHVQFSDSQSVSMPSAFLGRVAAES